MTSFLHELHLSSIMVKVKLFFRDISYTHDYNLFCMHLWDNRTAPNYR